MQEKLQYALAAGWKEIQLSFSKKLHIATVQNWTALTAWSGIVIGRPETRKHMPDSQEIQHNSFVSKTL